MKVQNTGAEDTIGLRIKILWDSVFLVLPLLLKFATHLLPFGQPLFLH